MEMNGIQQHVTTRSGKWSRIGQLAKGAAIAECNRERARRAQPGCWTAVEMKIVMETYPDYKRMQERLPHRSLTQLKKFAYCYGIVKKRHVWTAPEIAILTKAGKERWGKEQLCAALPHLTPSQIHAQFLRHGFKYRHGLKSIDVPVLDDVRAQAQKMNLSLIDLDAISGGGQFWQKCVRKPNWRKITKVLQFMGGHFRVEFDEVTEA